MLGRHQGLRKSYVLGTTVTERIADSVVVMAVAGVALPLATSVPAWLSAAAPIVSALAVSALIVLWVAPRFSHRVEAVINRIPFGEALRQRLVDIFHQFLIGSQAIRSLPSAFGFTGISVLAWMLDGVTVLLVADALHLALTPGQALLYVVALALASAAPSTPGYIGVYQFVAVTVLTPFGLTQGEALAHILVYQAGLYVVVTLLGSFGLWRISGTGQQAPAS